MPIDDLIAVKQKKLEEQKKVADEMNRLFTKEGGLLETSTRAQKDLVVCITVAKRAGYRNYYQPPDEVQKIVRQDELRKMTKKIERIQGELNSIDAEITQLEVSARSAKPAEQFQMGSLKEVTRPPVIIIYL